MPIFVALVNLWRNDQPITTAKWVTGIAAVLGVALLITNGALNQLVRGTGQNLVGVALALGCALLVGGYTVLARPYIGRYGALRITTLSMAVAAVALWLPGPQASVAFGLAHPVAQRLA